MYQLPRMDAIIYCRHVLIKITSKEPRKTSGLVNNCLKRQPFIDSAWRPGITTVRTSQLTLPVTP